MQRQLFCEKNTSAIVTFSIWLMFFVHVLLSWGCSTDPVRIVFFKMLWMVWKRRSLYPMSDALIWIWQWTFCGGNKFEFSGLFYFNRLLILWYTLTVRFLPTSRMQKDPKPISHLPPAEGRASKSSQISQKWKIHYFEVSFEFHVYKIVASWRRIPLIQ